MKRIRKTLNVVVTTCLVLLSGSVHAVGGDDVMVGILQMARSGRNAEAIVLYEEQPDTEAMPIDVLRAVAGCYWREGRFDEARALYRHILDRQSRAGTVAAGVQPVLLALEEKATESLSVDSGRKPAIMEPEEKGRGTAESPATGMAASAVLDNELAVLRAAARELHDDREQSRRGVESRIAELTAETEARVNEIAVWRERLAAESGRADTAEKARAESERQVAGVREQLRILETELDAARADYMLLSEESEQKSNVLLDAVEEERRRRESVETDFRQTGAELALRLRASAAVLDDKDRELQAVREQLASQEALTAEAVQDSSAREGALLGQIEALRSADAAASLRVVALEQSLTQWRDRLDEVTAELAEREQDLIDPLTVVTQSTMELALEEIERLESEYASLDEASKQRQAALQSQIADLQARGDAAGTALEETAQAREHERQERLALGARYASQSDELERTRALLDEAAAALSRQYDALREQVQGGVTVRLEPAQDEASVATVFPDLSSDLSPLIVRLEAATASAMAEVVQLRLQIEQERAVFDEASSEATVERQVLKADLEALTKRIAGMEVAHAQELALLQEDYARQVDGLTGEIVAIRAVLVARTRALEAIENDLDAERDSTMRLLALAQESEALLGERIRQLESQLSKAEDRMQAVPAREGAAAAPSRAQEILDMLPADPLGAVALFEAFPPEADAPVAILKAMGNLYREQKRYEQALRLFERWLEKQPGDLYAERKLVMTLFDMGRYDQALDRLAGPAPVGGDVK